MSEEVLSSLPYIFAALLILGLFINFFDLISDDRMSVLFGYGCLIIATVGALTVALATTLSGSLLENVLLVVVIMVGLGQLIRTCVYILRGPTQTA